MDYPRIEQPQSPSHGIGQRHVNKISASRPTVSVPCSSAAAPCTAEAKMAKMHSKQSSQHNQILFTNPTARVTNASLNAFQRASTNTAQPRGLEITGTAINTVRVARDDFLVPHKVKDLSSRPMVRNHQETPVLDHVQGATQINIGITRNTGKVPPSGIPRALPGSRLLGHKSGNISKATGGYQGNTCPPYPLKHKPQRISEDTRDVGVGTFSGYMRPHHALKHKPQRLSNDVRDIVTRSLNSETGTRTPPRPLKHKPQRLSNSAREILMRNSREDGAFNQSSHNTETETTIGPLANKLLKRSERKSRHDSVFCLLPSQNPDAME